MIQQNKNIYISYWLLLITILLSFLIIVGGITRLTDSGLSITKWDLFSGILPPLTIESWEHSFSLYKKTPEYKILNSSMNLNEFKFIYWWEYIHRLLGRIIGLLYILPLLYFTFKKLISIKELFSFYFIFILICIQGFVGWYMVKSGLTERTDVSHYRLSLHLTLAFLIFILLNMKYFKYKNLNRSREKKRLPLNLPIIFTFLILVQISIGALVSGLDAGKIYQTWPLMNQHYFPDDIILSESFTFKAFEIPSLMQFLHRNMAYFILLIFSIIFFKVFKNNNFFYLRSITLLISLLLILQIGLGILTILSGAQIFLASLHQIGSIFLISSSLMLVFKSSKN